MAVRHEHFMIGPAAKANENTINARSTELHTPSALGNNQRDIMRERERRIDLQSRHAIILAIWSEDEARQ